MVIEEAQWADVCCRYIEVRVLMRSDVPVTFKSVPS